MESVLSFANQMADITARAMLNPIVEVTNRTPAGVYRSRSSSMAGRRSARSVIAPAVPTEATISTTTALK